MVARSRKSAASGFAVEGGGPNAPKPSSVRSGATVTFSFPGQVSYWSTASYLPGYEGSRPVRIGNAASEQFQLDVYGEVAAVMSVGAERLGRIEASVQAILDRETRKDWYTTEEVGKILGKSEYTVREWCRQGRIKGEKKGSGRGKYQSWVVSHDELLRVQREGLLPVRAC